MYMRTREEIENAVRNGYGIEIAKYELLLDIRDLLIKE